MKLTAAQRRVLSEMRDTGTYKPTGSTTWKVAATLKQLGLAKWVVGHDGAAWLLTPAGQRALAVGGGKR